MSLTPNIFLTELWIIEGREHSKQTVYFQSYKNPQVHFGWSAVAPITTPYEPKLELLCLALVISQIQSVMSPWKKHQCLLMFDCWGGRSSWRSPYHPNMYSIALVTTPVLLVGVFVPGTTLFSPWASLRMKFRQQTLLNFWLMWKFVIDVIIVRPVGLGEWSYRPWSASQIWTQIGHACI